MSENDDDLPVRYKSRAGALSTSRAGELPRRGIVSAAIATVEARQNLKFEQVEVERQENNTRLIQAQRASELAQHELETVDQDKDLIDAARANDYQRTVVDTERAIKEGQAQMSEFDAVLESNMADKADAEARAAEADVRRLQAELEKQRLQERLNGCSGSQTERMDALEQQLQDLLVKQIELEEQVDELQAAVGQGDPAAAAKLRSKRAEYQVLHERLERVRRELNNLSGL